MITIPGRFAGPATVAHTCPEIVAPSRAVNSTGRTSPYPFVAQLLSRMSPAQPLERFQHRSSVKKRPGSAASVASAWAVLAALSAASCVWYCGVS